VIAVFSLRGGIGVSTLATNLAAGLAQLWGQPTALVDLVLASGQSALMLNAPLRHTWADLAESSIGEIDGDLVESLLLNHACGTRVLAAAVRPEQSELISAEKVAHVISLLKERYDYVVLDLPHDFSDTTLAGLDAAHQVLVMVACAVDVFDHLDYAHERVALVLNSTFERGGLARKDIEATLKRPIVMALPYMPEPLVSAINRGVPPVLDLAHKPAGAVFEEFALFVSKDEHRSTRPTHPTEAWQRLAQRQQRRRAS
jgi:pilus assembly protein CpaE